MSYRWFIQVQFAIMVLLTTDTGIFLAALMILLPTFVATQCSKGSKTVERSIAFTQAALIAAAHCLK